MYYQANLKILEIMRISEELYQYIL